MQQTMSPPSLIGPSDGLPALFVYCKLHSLLALSVSFDNIFRSQFGNSAFLLILSLYMHMIILTSQVSEILFWVCFSQYLKI